MTHIETIAFEDADERCEAAAIVRVDKDNVTLSLTLKTNGDMQVVMPRDAATRLHTALGKALSSHK